MSVCMCVYVCVRARACMRLPACVSVQLLRVAVTDWVLPPGPGCHVCTKSPLAAGMSHAPGVPHECFTGGRNVACTWCPSTHACLPACKQAHATRTHRVLLRDLRQHLQLFLRLGWLHLQAGKAFVHKVKGRAHTAQPLGLLPPAYAHKHTFNTLTPLHAHTYMLAHAHARPRARPHAHAPPPLPPARPLTSRQRMRLAFTCHLLHSGASALASATNSLPYFELKIWRSVPSSGMSEMRCGHAAGEGRAWVGGEG